MNMNKTILATLITTAFSSNVIAQSVDTGSHTEQSGVAYEQDDSSAWKAVGGGALALTAAVLSGSSSSSSNGSSSLPEYEQGPIKDKPVLPKWEGEIELKTVEINGTTYLTGFITGVGEDARHVDIAGFGKDGNNAIRLNGSEGNDVRVITHEGEIAELRINGQVITKDYLNGKDRLPVADNNPILPEVDGDVGAKELSIIDGGIFFGEDKIGFIASDGNVNLYEHGKVGTAVYNGQGSLTAIQGNNGRELALRDDRVTLVGERGSVTMIRTDGSIRIDHNYTHPVEDGTDARKFSKNIDRTKLQNIKTQVMNRLAK